VQNHFQDSEIKLITDISHTLPTSLFQDPAITVCLIAFSWTDKTTVLNKALKQRWRERKSPSREKWTIFQFLLCSSFAAWRRTHPFRQFAFDVCRLLQRLRVPASTGLCLWTLRASRMPLCEVRLMLCSSSWLALTPRTLTPVLGTLVRRCRRSDTALHGLHRLQQTQHHIQHHFLHSPFLWALYAHHSTRSLSLSNTNLLSVLLFALYLAPAASALQLLKFGTHSLHLFECVPGPTLSLSSQDYFQQAFQSA